MVKHSFDCLFSFAKPPKICTFKGLSAVATDKRCEHCLCSQTTRATNCATPGYIYILVCFLLISFPLSVCGASLRNIVA